MDSRGRLSYIRLAEKSQAAAKKYPAETQGPTCVCALRGDTQVSPYRNCPLSGNRYRAMAGGRYKYMAFLLPSRHFRPQSFSVKPKIPLNPGQGGFGRISSEFLQQILLQDKIRGQKTRSMLPDDVGDHGFVDLRVLGGHQGSQGKNPRASWTDSVPSAESLRPVKGKVSGPRWH
jgi:hypothetical protein